MQQADLIAPQTPRSSPQRARAHFETWTTWLRANDVTFEVDSQLIHGPDHDGALIPDRGAVSSFHAEGHAPVVEHRDADAVLAADHATRLVARCLGTHVRIGGRRTLDLGCGTGTLGVLMHRLGARSVSASDLQPEAVQLAERTARANDATVRVYESDLFKGIPTPRTPREQFDLMVGTLPHKPFGSTERGVLPIAQAGGVDGTGLIRDMLEDVHTYLAPGGELVFFLHSLPDVSLLRDVSRMGSLRLLAWRRRVIQRGEYDALMPLFESRHEEGGSLLVSRDTRRAMMCGVWSVRLGA